MTKLKKNDLKRDRVQSTAFHVGIELELVAPCDGGSRSHDDDGCEDNQRSHYGDMSTRNLLMDYLGLERNAANAVESYFDRDQYISDLMDGWSCDDSECGYFSGSDGESKRDEMRADLVRLTGNTSVKVVEDGSVEKDDDSETDAEVCWNYFASKETIQDNAKILKYLKDEGCDFNKSCGLHINLNNYLKLETAEIPTAKLDFLFNFVGASRRSSTYCTRMAVSNDQKHSMIYHQVDRLEFRFFSPTLEADKLNHYVTLANTVYRRLAGQDAKLPKKSMTYFIDKMVKVNSVSVETAQDSMKKLNSLKSLAEFKAIEALEKAERDAKDRAEAEALDREILITLAPKFESIQAAFEQHYTMTLSELEPLLRNVIDTRYVAYSLNYDTRKMHDQLTEMRQVLSDRRYTLNQREIDARTLTDQLQSESA